MPNPSFPPKPRSEDNRLYLTRLPDLTPGRVRFRVWGQRVFRLAVRLLTWATAFGPENFPREGPALIVVNHLGDADAAVALAYFPNQPDSFAKVELYDLPFWGWLSEQYGPIWVHRGRPDRKALRAALQAFEQGRMVALAPEGRQSITGGLEEGTGGAAYLALKGGVPIVPVTFTGTENANIYGSWRKLRRPRVTITIGPPFFLEPHADLREAIRRGTDEIMRRLASQLPKEYRGIYQDALEKESPACAV